MLVVVQLVVARSVEAALDDVEAGEQWPPDAGPEQHLVVATPLARLPFRIDLSHPLEIEIGAVEAPHSAASIASSNPASLRHPHRAASSRRVSRSRVPGGMPIGGRGEAPLIQTNQA